MNRRLGERSRALLLVVALGVAASLSGYYLVHKPVTPAQAAALASTLANAGVALLLTLLAGGLGGRLLRGWLLTSAGERVALHSALGWGVMGLALLALGVAKLYDPVTLWVGALGLLILLWRDIRRWLADLSQALAVFWPLDGFSQFAALLVLFTLALGLLQALAPPLKWDALVYHLTLPKLYAQTRGVKLGGDFFFAGMPQLTEMLYTAAYLLRGEIAAQVLGWAFGAILVIGLAAHAAEIFGPRRAPLAPAILLASLTIALSFAWAYADLLLMLLALALLVTLRQWRFTREPRWRLLGGVLAGLAMGCKYTGVILPLAAVVTIAFDYLRTRPITQSPNHSIGLQPQSLNRPSTAIAPRKASNAKRPITTSLLHLVTLSSSFLLAAGLFASPWLLKNWLFTGNPFYPLLIPTPSPGDASRGVDSLRLWFYNRPDLTERNPVWAAAIFLRAVFLGAQGANNYDATLSPLLAFLPLALASGWRRLAPETRRELSPLALFTLVSYALWVILTFVSYYAVQARLFFSLFPALALLGVGGIAAIAQFDSPALRLSVVARAAFALVLGLSAVEYALAFVSHTPLAYLSGGQTAADYRAANLGWYTVAIDRVNALPAGARVLFLWEPRSLECASPDRCLPDLIIDRWWHLRRSRTLGAADAVIAQWKEDGLTHILLYDLGVQFVQSQSDNPFEDDDWAELDALRARLRLVENIGGVYSLYALP